MKKISIIIPCFNQAQYLNDCLTSVLGQNFKDWECIIVNDGSSDNTEEIVKEWVLRDKRLSYIKIENRGVSNARNVGVKKASGEFILPLDADDKIGENYLGLAIQEFEKNEFLTLVYCKAEKFGNKKGTWNLNPYKYEELTKDSVIFCSAIFRKEDWASVGGYDVNMIYGLEDWEFWISILKNKGKVVKLDDIGFYYRVKPVSRNKDLDVERKKMMYNYMSTKHAEFFIEQHGNFIYLDQRYKALEKVLDKNLRSRKYIANQFFKTFFGFKIFKEKETK